MSGSMTTLVPVVSSGLARNAANWARSGEVRI